MKSVSVPYGTAIPGVAGLAVSSTRTNSTNSTSSSDSGSSSGSGSSSSRDAAIGAGVGVPLGVIAIGSLIWAIWERRGRMRALAGTSQGQETAQSYPQMTYRNAPVELQAPEVELSGSTAATEIGSEGHPKPNRMPVD